MILARAWGCTPDQLRGVTVLEWQLMVEQLHSEAEAAERARRRGR